MKFLTDEATLFFLQRPEDLDLWETLAAWVEAHFPAAEMTVQRTQISFRRRYGFMFLSLPPKKYAPEGMPCIRVSFGLPRPLEGERVMASACISAKRYTHHTLVCRPEDLDQWLLDLLEESWDMAR